MPKRKEKGRMIGPVDHNGCVEELLRPMRGAGEF